MFGLYLNLIEAMVVVSKGTKSNDIEDKTIIGKFQNKDVIKTNHVYDIRKGDWKEWNLIRNYRINIIILLIKIRTINTTIWFLLWTIKPLDLLPLYSKTDV